VVVTVPTTQYSVSASILPDWAITKNSHINLANLTLARVGINKNGGSGQTIYSGGDSRVRRSGAGQGNIFVVSKFQEIIVVSGNFPSLEINQNDFYNYY
jgi:hypothetical protein